MARCKVTLALALVWKQDCFKETKPGRNFITRYIVQHVGKQRNSLFRQKKNGNTHLEGNGVGIFPSEEEFHKEEIKSIKNGQFIWVFVLLWPIILLLSYIWPDLGPYLICLCIFLPRGIPVQRLMGGLTTPTMGKHPFPFWPLRSLPTCVQLERFSWPQE